jgi:hypothetical protein
MIESLVVSPRKGNAIVPLRFDTVQGKSAHPLVTPLHFGANQFEDILSAAQTPSPLARQDAFSTHVSAVSPLTPLCFETTPFDHAANIIAVAQTPSPLVRHNAASPLKDEVDPMSQFEFSAKSPLFRQNASSPLRDEINPIDELIMVKTKV